MMIGKLFIYDDHVQFIYLSIISYVNVLFYITFRYILQYATVCKGIVISSDQYRDLYREKPEWRDTIVNRLLAPTFVGDYVMFPEDPLGRNGPTLQEFLRY